MDLRCWLLVGLVALGGSGCAGYKLGPVNGQTAGAKSVQINPFTNTTLEPRLGDEVTAQLRVPTIGIGAGPRCDGQVLVSYDAFGLYGEFVPRFVKQYASLGTEMMAAAKEYIADVREGRFPSPARRAGARRNRKAK